MDELFSRDEILAGLQGSRAKRLLFGLESHTAYMIIQARQVIQRLFGMDAEEEIPYQLDESGLVASLPTIRISIQDLERYAPYWAELIPENPKPKQLCHDSRHLVRGRACRPRAREL